MKTYNISINTSSNTYINFEKVKVEDVSEIVRLMALYADVTNITISVNVNY